MGWGLGVWLAQARAAHPGGPFCPAKRSARSTRDERVVRIARLAVNPPTPATRAAARGTLACRQVHGKCSLVSVVCHFDEDPAHDVECGAAKCGECVWLAGCDWRVDTATPAVCGWVGAGWRAGQGGQAALQQLARAGPHRPCFAVAASRPPHARCLASSLGINPASCLPTATAHCSLPTPASAATAQCQRGCRPCSTKHTRPYVGPSTPKRPCAGCVGAGRGRGARRLERQRGCSAPHRLGLVLAAICIAAKPSQRRRQGTVFLSRSLAPLSGPL